MEQGTGDRHVLLGGPRWGCICLPSPPGHALPVDPPPGQVKGNAAAPASQRAALPLWCPTAAVGPLGLRSFLPIKPYASTVLLAMLGIFGALSCLSVEYGYGSIRRAGI